MPVIFERMRSKTNEKTLLARIEIKAIPFLRIVSYSVGIIYAFSEKILFVKIRLDFAEKHAIITEQPIVVIFCMKGGIIYE